MRSSLLACLILAAATPALAQDNKPAPIREPGPPQQVAPGTPPSTVVVPGGAANSGPGANTTVAPTGTGAATITTDSAVGGNAEQPSRGVPQTGGGGSGGGGGGGS
ncbi:hypothetical protein [Methylobacterium trifolii]|uniref:Translation initiation factor IF-2 n=1 Tax=Methylobacterium trifolii TaxID=1003092 RepID=A0ABQ4TUV7_9HYPH|nr:hypothetical protein [Methylobacterium trifolii]GJE59068.1 hypothetical protein MPOCJGCO_1155 [Methylobacterium trifolii]